MPTGYLWRSSAKFQVTSAKIADSNNRGNLDRALYVDYFFTECWWSRKSHVSNGQLFCQKEVGDNFIKL
jgi:hypothetical protein